jgi:hypothetical protein
MGDIKLLRTTTKVLTSNQEVLASNKKAPNACQSESEPKPKPKSFDNIAVDGHALLRESKIYTQKAWAKFLKSPPESIYNPPVPLPSKKRRKRPPRSIRNQKHGISGHNKRPAQ